MQDKDKKKSRRTFLKSGVVSLVGVGLGCSRTARKVSEQVEPATVPGQTTAEDKPKKEHKLVFRELGKTGFKVPVVGMGVGACSDDNVLAAALDAGIMHLDTAHGYGGGRNEEMVGRVIKDRPRDSYVLTTKVVADGEDRRTGLFTEATKPEPFVEKFETSLGRLGLDHVDILMLHSVVTKEATLFEPILSALVKLKKEGKTRLIGVSTHANEPEVIHAAVDSKEYDIVLTAYNFRQPHVKEVEAAMKRAAKAGLGVIAMKTQAGVYWDRERQHMINMKAALKWAIQNEDVHTTIPGIGTFEQLDENVSVMADLGLTGQEKEDLELGAKLGMNGLFCRQCGTCVAQCGEGIEIPTLMRSYMYTYGYGKLAKAKEALRDVELSRIPCSTCDECRVECTMGFDIKQKIEDIARIKDVPDDFLVG